ncbi:hypothetical protein H5407_13060 [Mitsuaria sp. WAJ17]|uniref:hypothetical protein n=1 Tax=Mitsuaria sp. WAJ17 TaxID=2761452 RepID=UPI0016047AF0|nr:hypothetical protein [Mitsuaria sp. WAJ17]MBB2486146.1 hypothetical protein [Mitsuaria sp. WAJ17]
MTKPPRHPMRPALTLALVAATLTSGCARMEPRLQVPDEVKLALQRVDLPGIGLSRSGRSEVDGRAFSFSRSASSMRWFGAFDSGSGELSLSLEGEPALGAHCRSSRADLKLFGLHLEKPLATECRVQHGALQSEMRLWTRSMGSPSQGEEVHGEWTTADGERVIVQSLHTNPAGGMLGRPLGFSIVRRGQTLALVDVSHWQPRLYLPREARAREDVLPVAMLMALLIQPGTSGN